MVLGRDLLVLLSLTVEAHCRSRLSRSPTNMTRKWEPIQSGLLTWGRFPLTQMIPMGLCHGVLGPWRRVAVWSGGGGWSGRGGRSPYMRIGMTSTTC